MQQSLLEDLHSAVGRDEPKEALHQEDNRAVSTQAEKSPATAKKAEQSAETYEEEGKTEGMTSQQDPGSTALVDNVRDSGDHMEQFAKGIQDFSDPLQAREEESKADASHDVSHQQLQASSEVDETRLQPENSLSVQEEGDAGLQPGNQARSLSPDFAPDQLLDLTFLMPPSHPATEDGDFRSEYNATSAICLSEAQTIINV
jgi:hypothetical protein